MLSFQDSKSKEQLNNVNHQQFEPFNDCRAEKLKRMKVILQLFVKAAL